MPLRLGIFGSTVIKPASRFPLPPSPRLTSLVVAGPLWTQRRRHAQADKFMALAKESETFDDYSIEKRGSCVRLEKQIGQFQCSFCSEETDFYDVRFEDTHWSVVPRQNMSPSGRRMTAEEVEEMERLQAAVTHLKVKFRVEINGALTPTPSTRRRSSSTSSTRARSPRRSPRATRASRSTISKCYCPSPS